jgi:hypothetical protein
MESFQLIQGIGHPFPLPNCDWLYDHPGTWSSSRYSSPGTFYLPLLAPRTRFADSESAQAL